MMYLSFFAGTALSLWGTFGRTSENRRAVLFLLAVLWYIDGDIVMTRHSIDALRVQEAQNACPCVVGEEGE